MLGASYSYSYSEALIQYGITNNAAADGMEWDMLDVLPIPGGLMVNGVIYQYTVDKEREDDMKVHIQNEHAFEDGYIFRETDDWSGLPGNRINKIVSFPDTNSTLFGRGSIETEGNGTVTDPNVMYSYKLDPCFVPLTDPSCPGYIQALYDWLKANGLLPKDTEIDDPYFNEFVQGMLKRKSEKEDETKKKKEEDKEDESIEELNAGASIEGLGDPAAQEAIMKALSMIPNFENYYAVNIQGGVYDDTLVLQDKNLPDNMNAMRNLSQDTLHRSMVRSQYDD